MKTLLERIAAMEAEAKELSKEIEAAGQMVAAYAFDDVLIGLSKTQGVWNHAIKDTNELN
jgi:hypothetical protein